MKFSKTIFALLFSVQATAVHEDSDENIREMLLSLMDAAHDALVKEGADYLPFEASYITDNVENQGQTILAKDVGNKRLESHFVPCDTRRASWSPRSETGDCPITYAIDTTNDGEPPKGGLTQKETDAAIERAAKTIDNVNCASLPLLRNPDDGEDIGRLAWLLELGGSPSVFADVQHAGFRDIDFVDGRIIAATITFAFARSGVFTDVDNDGRLDTAFREIYYDPSHKWADDGVSNVDVESVALHEFLHGLSQAHFGKVSRDQNNSIKKAPEAVMNAIYTGPSRELKGTDVGGFCSNWANWPNKNNKGPKKNNNGPKKNNNGPKKNNKGH